LQLFSNIHAKDFFITKQPEKKTLSAILFKKKGQMKNYDQDCIKAGYEI